jgi:peptide-methionine (S)-S-oxide reductase
MFMFKPKVSGLLPADQCPPGREQPAADIAKPTDKHFIKGTPLHGPFPEGLESIIFGMGCFWCSEALFYEMDGVYSTQVSKSQELF